MSWKTEVYAEGEWNTNGLVFATSDEAKAYGRELLSRWSIPTDSRPVEVNDEVNYRFDFTLWKAVRLEG